MFTTEEVKPEEAKTEEAEKKKDDDDIDTDEELEMLQKNDNVFVSDFDLMMERKKTERSKQMSRRKKEVWFLVCKMVIFVANFIIYYTH